MNAGRKDRKIAVHRAVTTQDDYGQEQSTWGLLAYAFAELKWGRGDERRSAASTEAPQSATFIVWTSATMRAVNVKDRIYFDGSAWNIQGIAEPNRGEVEFTAIRDASAPAI